MPLWQLFYQLFQASFFFINCFIKHVSVFHLLLTKNPPLPLTHHPLQLMTLCEFFYSLRYPFQSSPPQKEGMKKVGCSTEPYEKRSKMYFQAPRPSTHWLKKILCTVYIYFCIVLKNVNVRNI